MTVARPSAGANLQKSTIYLDQNVLGYVRDGDINLAAVEDVQWVYSNEHFNEIARGGDRSLLDVLDKLRACEIELRLDEQSRITDSAIIHEYTNPSARYDRHQVTVAETPLDTSLFADLSVRLFGGNNYENVVTLPERWNTHLSQLLEQAGMSDAARLLFPEQGHFAKALDAFVAELRGHQSIEVIRKTLVGAKNGPATATENPIQEIVDLMTARIPGLDIAHLLGSVPIRNKDDDTWTMYRRIIHCFTFLNMVGYMPDRGIRNAENFPNIMSDATHISNAAFCRAVMSEDKRFCAKARAIYAYLNINTRVMQLQFQ